MTQQTESVRLQLAWRTWGAAITLVGIQHLRNYPLEYFIAERPLVFHAFWLCGALALVAGPRQWVQGIAAASGLAFLAHAGLSEHGMEVFYGDEYAFQVLVPVAAFGVGISARVRKLDPEALVHEQLHLLRLVLLITLGAAAFHKLNADFLDPATSCAGLSVRLESWWGLPLPSFAPWVVVAGEGTAVLALWIRPRLGIALVLGMTAALAAIGPAAFNLTLVALAVAFFPRGDAPTLRRCLARPLLPLALAAVVVSLAFGLWQGPMRFVRYGFFGVAWSVVAGCWLAVALRRLRPLAVMQRRLAKVFGTWRPRGARWAVPPWSSTLALLLVVNALSPYLGVKHRYSAAMLSNLRADGTRYNHVLVPRRMLLRDDYVHVVELESPGGVSQHLARGVFAPEVFATRLKAAAAAGDRSSLRVVFRGETTHFESVATDLSAVGFANALPRKPLLARELAPGRQSCVH